MKKIIGNVKIVKNESKVQDSIEQGNMPKTGENETVLILITILVALITGSISYIKYKRLLKREKVEILNSE